MLTDTQCRTAKPKEKLYRLNDFNGLYLEVKPNGKKAWRYRFKLNGKSSMFALGEYPTVKLAEAREKCEQARKQVADGVSPTQARQLDKIRKVNDASNTFELIAKEWLQMKDWAGITKTRRLDMLERVVFPAIGKLPVREITPHHILKILQETAKRGAPTVAAEARRTISSVFELAVATLRAVLTIVVARIRLTIACGLCGGHWRVLQKPPKQNGQNSILITPYGLFRQRE